MDEIFLYETPCLIRFETHCLQLVKGASPEEPPDPEDPIIP